MPTDEGTPNSPGNCDRCGGAPIRSDDAGAPVFECEDCGNVLGLAGTGLGDDAGTDTDGGTASRAAISTEEVTATDGSLDQLVGVLRSEGGPEGRVSTERLRLETGEATLVVTAEDGTVVVRERRDA
ncbi:hypothetical protein [Natronomonas marina]|jgi:hypothetical protein|uniref:hypothetical protein n=1 Tax=Natronomonas marina TaxID=2961939 RepID=UPI0020C95987|nr:hypothetical protein [Natronomonas marina]